MMQRSKTYLYNASFALNCLLVFLLIFEKGLFVPPWVQAVGRLHPLLLHFPIVLLEACIFFGLQKSAQAGANCVRRLPFTHYFTYISSQCFDGIITFQRRWLCGRYTSLA